ncbi:CDF family Co(II)/Ni(II) efflux transporter DmeF [Candidatus Binatia bacterium]|nr:CDF family Co(II)/Ni(II) efflux transporter DmeF [Candidatus Binatia bacterium]
MHEHEAIGTWQHSHDYLSAQTEKAERNTWRVIALTAVMMVVEIAAGTLLGSMALLADGWHMASHVSALGISAFAYAYARRHAKNARYSFGTWKVGVLGGFSSALVLGVIAALIAWESLGRLREPLAIGFDEAIFVAFVGLAVNLVSAWMLDVPHDDDGHHGHDHAPGHEHAHQDHNLRAAYMHVVADALTSVFAIAALLAGKYLGWVWMDPLMGVAGAVVIARWSYGLLGDTARVLLDGDVEPELAERLRTCIERHADNRVVDLHLWRVGPQHLYGIISLVTHDPLPPDHYKSLLEDLADLSHVTVEVNRCPGETCAPEPLPS